MDILIRPDISIQYHHPTLYVTLKTPSSKVMSSWTMPVTGLLDLADALQDASTKLRGIVADLEPGEAFERNQAIQFGAERLEGDL